jgi:hypothetical protein
VGLAISGLTPGDLSYRRGAARRERDQLLIAAPQHRMGCWFQSAVVFIITSGLLALL